MDEAEYAWLPVDCMKEFHTGDTCGDVEGPVSADPTLQACVEAAGRAVLEGERQAAARAKASASPRGESPQADSDGGELRMNWFGGRMV